MGTRIGTVAAALLWLVAASCAIADDAVERINGERVWHLTTYLNGTTPEIAKALNHQLEELLQTKQELVNRRGELQRQFDDHTNDIVASARETDDYKAIAKKAADAKAAHEDAQRREDGKAALDLGSEYNLARQAMNKIDTAVQRSDRLLKDIRENIAEKNRRLSEIEPSITDARAWREKMIDALRNSARLPGPIKIGNRGVLGKLKVRQVLSGNQFTADFEAYEDETKEKVAGANAGDGINTYLSHYRVKILLITGFDSSKLSTGSDALIDTCCEVTGSKMVGDDLAYTVEPCWDNDLTKLFKAIDDLHQPPSPTSQPVQKSN